MKKLLIALCAIVMCLAATSCQNYVDKAKALADEVKKDAKKWDVDTWEAKMTEMAELMCDFAESNPTKEEYKAFKKNYERLTNNLERLPNKAMQKMEKAEKRVEKNKELKRRVRKATKILSRLERKFDRGSGDDDDEDEDDYDDGDDDEDEDEDEEEDW